MVHSIQCKCGTLRGEVRVAGVAAHGVCYCHDCQTYARYLSANGETLDANGGTEVVATICSRVSFTAGLENLKCHSLSERGLLRWYAACCNTPIANTLRRYKAPYVGLVHSCLGGAAAIERSFGPVSMRVNTDGAKGNVSAMTGSKISTLLGFVPSLIVARLSGGYKQTPFFHRGGEPVVAPRVLTAAEREAAAAAV